MNPVMIDSNWNAVNEIERQTGIVNTQAQIRVLATPHLTAESLLVDPVPIIAPAIV